MSYFRNLVKAAFAPPLRAMGIASAFEGSAVTRRTRSMASRSTQGPNSLISGNGYELLRRARGTVRNNAWAANALDSYASNAIGTGIKPQPKHPNQKKREKLQEDFLRWTDQCDAAGISDYYGQQNLEVREAMEAGEVFVRLRPRRPEDGLIVPLQRQLLEAEHVPYNLDKDLENGNIIRNGIEFNMIGRRVAYHMYRSHPGEFGGFTNVELVRVPADQVLHLFNPVRAGQHRGQTWLTQVILRLEELDKYEDAELVRKQMAAMITHIITELNENDPVVTGEEVDEDGTPIAPIEPGSTIKLRPGENIVQSQAADVGGMYSEFLMWNLYAIAAGLGITFEQLTGNLKGVSYSSIRQGRQEFVRRCERFQHQVVVYQDCRPTWKAWCDAAALVGVIDAREYREHPEWYEADWLPPKWPYVNPKDDVDTDIAMVRAGFKSQSQVINSLGEDPERVRRQIAADNASNDRLKLQFDSDGRKAEGSGATTEAAAIAAPNRDDGQMPGEVIQ
jgi:lambda family phage portal protein